MKTQEVHKGKITLYTTIASIGILAILIGFFKTFITPIISGTKTWPLAIYIHASFAFGWMLLFLIQALLIQNRKFKTHVLLGRLGIFVALGAAFSIIPATLYQVERELKDGLGQMAINSIVGSLTSAIMFLVLVSLAVYFKKKPQTHKRLMLLATIILIWPAWFRWRHYFPSVERPDIWFAVVLADSLILVSFIWDWLINKRIHISLLLGGLFIISENVLEIILFDTGVWNAIANALYAFFK